MTAQFGALRFDGPTDAALTLVLAHGAGAPMDSPFMQAFAHGLAERGHRVARFEFPYMQKRRADGKRRPPDRAPVLQASYEAVVEALGGGRQVAIGGKSMGGRIASLIADGVGARGLVCLGYPFQPPGRPERPRTEHLATIETPTLIVQGTRDALGSRDEVAGYALAPTVRIVWLEDGDHGFKPRHASGRSEAENWAAGIDAVATFLVSRIRSSLY
jgi:predicted alpha/beta-hydrolase family hydrolase